MDSALSMQDDESVGNLISPDRPVVNGRWGCKLSQKMFVGREYVLKHVRNKHTAVMEAKQEEVLLFARHSH